jgi:hypothetical protein
MQNINKLEEELKEMEPEEKFHAIEKAFDEPQIKASTPT